MSYTVSAADLTSVRFNESDRVSSVLQNIAVILSTPKGSVPLYRTFGVDMTFLDKPSPVAKVMMVPAAREAIQEWEPRAEVLDVVPVEDPARPGKMMPRVKVDIHDE